MAWFILVIAGLFEVCWSVGMRYTDGFTKPVPSVLTVLAIIVSMYLLSISARTLPIGTAYGVWVGIGAFGAFVLGVWLFDEPLTAPRVICISGLLASVIGLKLTS